MGKTMEMTACICFFCLFLSAFVLFCLLEMGKDIKSSFFNMFNLRCLLNIQLGCQVDNWIYRSELIGEEEMNLGVISI